MIEPTRAELERVLARIDGEQATVGRMTPLTMTQREYAVLRWFAVIGGGLDVVDEGSSPTATESV